MGVIIMNFINEQKNHLMNDLNESVCNKITDKIDDIIKQKYNYTNDQMLTYLRGVADAIIAERAYRDKQNSILHETVNQLVKATNILNAVLKELIPKSCDYCNQNPNDDDCHSYLCRDYENTITYWKHYDEVIQLLKECDCFNDRSKS